MMHPFSTALLIVLSLMHGVGPGRARADITADDLAGLGDADFARRHATTRKLLADESLTPTQLAAAYAKAATAEQKHRLMTVARHHLLRLTRERHYPLPADPAVARMGSALGLTYAAVTADELPELKQPAIRVDKTVAGFPSHASLEVGDLILAIQGEPVPADLSDDQQITRWFTGWLSDIDNPKRVYAGQVATLRVHRAGKTIEVRVKLAPYNALEPMNDTRLHRVFAQEWEKFRDEKLLKQSAPE